MLVRVSGHHDPLLLVAALLLLAEMTAAQSSSAAATLHKSLPAQWQQTTQLVVMLHWCGKAT
jgi:hypothetical protein